MLRGNRTQQVPRYLDWIAATRRAEAGSNPTQHRHICEVKHAGDHALDDTTGYTRFTQPIHHEISKIRDLSALPSNGSFVFGARPKILLPTADRRAVLPRRPAPARAISPIFITLPITFVRTKGNFHPTFQRTSGTDRRTGELRSSEILGRRFHHFYQEQLLHVVDP